jgi:carbon-monoxide dehydrogenase medium subunit
MYAEFDLVIPADLDEALAVLAEDSAAANGRSATMPLAGGTNMIVDLRARRITPGRLVSLAKLGSLRGIRVDDGRVVMGGGTTISDILHDSGLAEHASCLVDQARIFGGQMVRNTATVAGNICSGSPAADAVPALMALDAAVELTSKEGAQGARVVPLSAFFLGYKEDVRRSDELVTEVSWDLPPANSMSLFYKLARRQGDAITVVGIAVAMTVEAGRCSAVRIALGAVAPVVKRATAAEAMLAGNALTPELIDAAAEQAAEEADPIDDLRASAEYRRHGVKVLTRRQAEIPANATLLDSLRELGYFEVKSGCEKGDCGACAVLVDGEAVDSCLTLAWIVEGRAITTVAGLGQGEATHPVIDAFVKHGAVQCGYCIPGLIIAAESMLKVTPEPDDSDIRIGLSGNLCRCTGYTKVFDAVREAAQVMREREAQA